MRRALANVPTYMVFDDHDVTDDWNIGRAWRDRVFTSQLGRRIILNSLVAYTVFQDWGNDPLRYRTAPYKELLDLAFAYQPLSLAESPATTTPGPKAVKRLETLFGFNQPDPEDAGAAAQVALLDRRAAPPRGRARHAHPPRLPLALPAARPALSRRRSRSSSPTRTTAAAGRHRRARRRLADAGGAADDRDRGASSRSRRGSRSSSTTRVPQAHRPRARQRDLARRRRRATRRCCKRLAAYKKVVVLSGEVHFGASGRADVLDEGPEAARPRRRTLEADLNSRTNPITTPALRAAFGKAGITLSEHRVRRRSARATTSGW